MHKFVCAYAEFIYFENTGTPASYKYEAGKPLIHEGEIIFPDSRYGSATKPRAVDFNRDGFMDIIAGDEDGKVYFMKIRAA